MKKAYTSPLLDFRQFAGKAGAGYRIRKSTGDQPDPWVRSRPEESSADQPDPPAGSKPEPGIADQSDRDLADQLLDARQTFLRTVIVVCLIWFVLFHFVIGVTRIQGEDMDPALKDGDLVLYDRIIPGLTDQDAVIYSVDGEEYAGRILACAGQTIGSSQEQKLLIDGQVLPMLDQEGIFWDTEIRSGDRQTENRTLQKGEYYILGDKRSTARDSRVFGPVERNNIQGEILFVFRMRGI